MDLCLYIKPTKQSLQTKAGLSVPGTAVSECKFWFPGLGVSMKTQIHNRVLSKAEIDTG